MTFMKSYLEVLNEGTQEAKKSCVAADNTGELEGAEKVKKAIPGSGPEAAETPQNPAECCHSAEAEVEEVKESKSRNPFDDLYNKIIAQEAFGEDEDEEEALTSNELTDDSDAIAALDDLDVEEDEEEDEEEGLESVLSHLKSAVTALEALIGEEEAEEAEEGEETEETEEGEEGEDMFDIEFSPEEGIAKESVEVKNGEALTKKEKQCVKNAVPVSKKKALSPKKKEVDGKPTPLKDKGEKLTKSSSQNTGGVKAGKGLFEQ